MTKKAKKKQSKTLRKSKKTEKRSTKKTNQSAKTPSRVPNNPIPLVESKTIILAGGSTTVAGAPESRPVFDIELSDIDGDTTIGDLLVVFPRTRDILFKHGVNFDVEEAGYVYMTLNVFSAMHGVKIKNLLEELLIASKEVTPPPGLQQTTRALTVSTPTS